MSKKMEKGTENAIFLDGREYTAADLYRLIGLLVGNGVYANELAPTATNEDMSITHGAGHAWISGVAYWNTTPFILEIATADGSLNRYDSLMLRLNLSLNEVYATIVQGDYATNPTPPACTRNAETFDLKLCDIYVPAGCTKITQDQITDTRLDSSVCGVPVFPVEHMDMTSFYRQIATDLANFQQGNEAEFSAWVEDQKDSNLATLAALVEVVRNTSDGSVAEIEALLQQLNALVDSDTVGELTIAINDKLPKTGGDMTGAINMNGKPLRGLNAPTDDTEAAPKSYVDKMLPKSGGAMTGPIAMGGNKITDLGNPENDADAASKGYVDTSVAKAAPRNLLDNSDFRNPVNQRGQSSYTEHWGHTIDRWYLSSGDSSGSIKATVTLTDGGLKFTPSSEAAARIALVQRLPQNVLRAGVDYTFVAKKSDGDYLFGGIEDDTASYGFWQVVLFIDTEVTLEWAALYEGSYTAETLPEYQPKGYAVELAECQRYFRWLKIGGAVNGNYIGYRIPLSPAMRTNPSTTGININTMSGPATITAGGHTAESDCFRVDVYIGSDADKWWTCDVALSADL